jgi:hypothetical protein
MLAHCVELGYDWVRVSACVKHLGTRVEREAAHCQLEYERVRAQWAASTRVVATARKLAEAARAARAAQLGKRVAQRSQLVAQMRQMAANAQQDPDVDRLVRACQSDAASARIAARGETMAAWRESFADDDDGFGPFRGRAPPGTPPTLSAAPAAERQQVQPFDAPELDAALRRPKRRLLCSALPPGESGDEDASDSTFLLSVFESIAGHRQAGPFQEAVGEAEAPGYAAAVRRPMWLAAVRAELHSGAVASTPQLLRQLLLMTCNARLFNAPGSPVHEAAKALDDVIRRECEPLLIVELLRKRMRRGGAAPDE